MALADGLYRIRHSNPKLCLTLGKSDKIVGSSLYVDEQQDIAGQAVCDQRSLLERSYLTVLFFVFNLLLPKVECPQ